MSDSILNNIKKMLGIAEDYTVFDVDIVIYINTAFSTLNQCGLGPANGFMISDATPTWDAFIGADPKLNSVKTYVYLRTRLLFDPPQTSYLIASFEKVCQELEWRLNVVREHTEWIDPTPVNLNDEVVLDGGNP